MSKHEKTLQRMLDEPTPVDIRWDDLKGALKHLGYTMLNNTGSRRKFFNHDKNSLIMIHEPHPQPVVKQYAIRQVVQNLRDAGVI